MLLVLYMLLRLLLVVILQLNLGCSDSLNLAYLRRRLTVLLNQHRRVNLVAHSATDQVHLLFLIFDTLGSFLSAEFRKRHAHCVLARRLLIVTLSHATRICLASSLGLRDLLVEAGTHTLV